MELEFPPDQLIWQRGQKGCVDVAEALFEEKGAGDRFPDVEGSERAASDAVRPSGPDGLVPFEDKPGPPHFTPRADQGMTYCRPKAVVTAGPRTKPLDDVRLTSVRKLYSLEDKRVSVRVRGSHFLRSKY